jgi:GGDEF domain-containing protein
MKRITLKTATPAVAACALGTLAALLLDRPLLALVGAAIAAAAVGVQRLRARPRAAVATAPRVEATPTRTPQLDDALIDAVSREIARAERHAEPLTICLVRAEGFAGQGEAQRSATASHLRATVERVTRASDSWFELAPDQYAVVLERCSAVDAATFAERLAFAAASRPVIAEGARVPVDITTACLEYNHHQFVGARDFLAAACASRFLRPGYRQRLVADGRLLREQFYGKDRTAGAA